MTFLAAVLAPVSYSPAIELSGRVWRKRLLPVGSIDYQGRKIHFGRGYLEDLVTAFRDKAYGQVPFQLATADNAHTNDPDRYRGEVLDLELDEDGLHALVRTTPEGERVLAENPRLGISARIVEEYARSDGRYFPAAIQHVLGTLDPRIPDLGDWHAIEASSDRPVRVIDLSNCRFSDDEWDLDLSGLDATPAEVAALDQVLAETDDEEAAEADVDGWMDDLDGSASWQDELELANDACDEMMLVSDGGEPGVPLGRVHELLGRLTARRAMKNADFGGFEIAARTRVEEAERRQARAWITELSNTTPWPQSEPPLSVTGRPACGSTDADGNCIERYHQHGCGFLAEPGVGLALAGHMRAASSRTTLDGEGQIWRDQYGDPMTMIGMMESLSRQRLTSESQFEQGSERREAAVARPQLGGVSPETRAAADAVARQAGLTRPGDPREPVRQARARYDEWAAQHPYSAPRRNLETTRDRAERHHRPTVLRREADTLLGAVGGFSAA